MGLNKTLGRYKKFIQRTVIALRYGMKEEDCKTELKMNGLNEYPTVVLKPGGRVGGTNAPVNVNLKPTEFKGGGNEASKFIVTPSK